MMSKEVCKVGQPTLQGALSSRLDSGYLPDAWLRQVETRELHGRPPATTEE